MPVQAAPHGQRIYDRLAAELKFTGGDIYAAGFFRTLTWGEG